MAAERRFYVRPAGEAEIAGAIGGYRNKHPGLEVAFVEEVDRASPRSANRPFSGI